jgi:hypothetical protein
MLGSLKLPAIAIAGVTVVSVVGMSYQAIDIKLNYTLTSATISAVQTDCFVERSYKERVVVEGTKDRAYMDCDDAPSTAAQYGFGTEDIRTRSKAEYVYVSPVDSKSYTGSLERTDDALPVGKHINVYASDKVAEDSRTTKSNFFLDDTGV